MKRATLVLGLAVLLCGVTGAHATAITYTVSALASGSYQSQSFTNALVTIDFVSDTTTAHVHSGTPNTWMNTGSATITIEGLGTSPYDFGFVAFSEQGGPAHDCVAIPCFAGIGSGGPVGPTILGTDDSSFLTYDLTSATGPVTGPSEYTLNSDFGGLILTSVDGTSTFSALTSSLPTGGTPEPGSLILLGTGVASLSGFARRRFS